MNQQDVLFLVMILIVLSTMTVIVVQFVRSRRRGGDDRDERDQCTVAQTQDGEVRHG